MVPEETLLNCLPGRNTFRGNRTGLIPHYTEVCVYVYSGGRGRKHFLHHQT